MVLGVSIASAPQMAARAAEAASPSETAPAQTPPDAQEQTDAGRFSIALGSDTRDVPVDAGDSTAQLAEEAVRLAERDTAPNREDVEQAARDSASNDARILAAVNVALARAPAIPDIGVDVNSGVVTLSGSVVDDVQRERAARLAKGVQGVSEVDNQLQLSMDLGTRLQATMRELQRKATRWVAGTPLLIVALLIILGSHWLGKFISRRLSWLRLDSRNPYLDGVVSRVVYLVVLVSGAVMALDLLGATKLVGAVLGSAGVIGLALGFAFKDIAENHIAGIMLSLRRPFAPGDTVNIDGKEGRVVSLSSRATILMTLDGNHLRLPNAMVFKAVILNYSANPKRRIQFRTDIDAAESVSEAQHAALQAICAVDGILADPPARVLVREFGSAGVVLEMQAWIDQTRTDFIKASSACIHAVKKAFAQAGIEPTRTTHYMIEGGRAPELQPSRPSKADTIAVDTRAGDGIDEQLQQAQREQADTNLIADSRTREE